MKSRKFPTMEDAIQYLKSADGDAKYWGREGPDVKLIYTLTVGIKVYDVFVHTDGLLEVTGERYIRSDE